MKYAAVVGTNHGRDHWLNDFVSSISKDIPLVVVKQPGYEVGHIKWVYENTDIDRFIYFQDSFEIVDNELLLYLLKETDGSMCLMCGGWHPQSYTALFERKTLDLLDEIPFANNKAEAMGYEDKFIEMYRQKVEKMVCYPLNQNISMGVYRHGRENMLYSNELYKKYKGNWGQLSPDDYIKDPYM